MNVGVIVNGGDSILPIGSRHINPEQDRAQVNSLEKDRLVQDKVRELMWVEVLTLELENLLG